MSVFHIIFGAAAGTAGGAALIQSVRHRHERQFVARILLMCFGVSFVAYGILHFSEGIGLSWATPRLRSDLYLWFFVPCAVLWLMAWIAERRR
jgi:hypothetical protein